jgi:single-strand DNA-binding protein
MATLNLFMGICRLGNNPDEIKVYKEGKPYTRFSLAIDQGNNQTMWLQVTAWEKQAEFVEKYVHKGTSVFVQGRLQMQKYETKTK